MVPLIMFEGSHGELRSEPLREYFEHCQVQHGELVMTENHNEDSQANFLGSRWRAKKAAIQNPASGSFAGVYELLDQIDEDKMFVIFKARHPQNQKHAKIKLLKAEYLADKIAIMSVYKEAKEAALANSGFQDFGMTNSGCPYLVYKWDHEKE